MPVMPLARRGRENDRAPSEQVRGPPGDAAQIDCVVSILFRVIPPTTQHYPMLQRNLIYTGVTRGRRLVVLVGQRKALAIAVEGARTRRRWSKLREWLVACDRL
jgi:ATP-dependent exoDNAse (exonuclease V) alpha subunit